MSAAIIQFYGHEVGLDPDHYFTLTLHPGGAGIDIGNEITERLGPIILDIQSQAKPADGETDTQKAARAEALTQAIKQIFKVFPGSQLQAMAKRVLEYMKVACGEDANGKPIVYHLGKPADFSKYFQGNYKAVVPLMRRSIEENGFLDLDVSALVLGGGDEPSQAETAPPTDS